MRIEIPGVPEDCSQDADNLLFIITFVAGTNHAYIAE
jgi:hypothetical protein